MPGLPATSTIKRAYFAAAPPKDSSVIEFNPPGNAGFRSPEAVDEAEPSSSPRWTSLP